MKSFEWLCTTQTFQHKINSCSYLISNYIVFKVPDKMWVLVETVAVFASDLTRVEARRRVISSWPGTCNWHQYWHTSGYLTRLTRVRLDHVMDGQGFGNRFVLLLTENAECLLYFIFKDSFGILAQFECNKVISSMRNIKAIRIMSLVAVRIYSNYDYSDLWQ